MFYQTLIKCIVVPITCRHGNCIRVRHHHCSGAAAFTFLSRLCSLRCDLLLCLQDIVLRVFSAGLVLNKATESIVKYESKTCKEISV